jgi:hypothetical protein
MEDEMRNQLNTKLFALGVAATTVVALAAPALAEAGRIGYG